MEKDFNMYKSRKGSYAVTALELHEMLEFNPGMYKVHIKRWLNDSYVFENEVRRPVILKDYSLRKGESVNGIKDYYISLNMARQIVLHSNARNKLTLARKLMKFEYESLLFDEKEIMNILKYVRIMSRTSYQHLAEKMHRAYFDNQTNELDWWAYRSQMLNHHADLSHKLSKQWSQKQSDSFRKNCLAQNPLELVRIGVMDLLISKGKSMLYASKMGGIAKDFAEEWGITVYEDSVSAHLFAPPLDTQKMNEFLFATSA